MKLTLLDNAGIDQIDQTARHILNTTGVDIPHEKMRSLFAAAGAKTDPGSNRIRIPSFLIDQCLTSTGKTFTLYGRDRNQKAEFGVGKRNYNSIAGEAYWIENNGNRRFACLDDVVLAAKLGQQLPGLTIAGAMADPHEINQNYRCVAVAAELLRYTTKPVTFWFHDRTSAAYVVELLSVIAGSKDELARYPLAYPFLEPISPLKFPRRGIDLLFETCKIPLPVPIGPMAQAGISAPATLAGTVALETAEILAGICVTQLIRPGTPVCFGGIPHAFDMKTMQMIFAGPEQGVMAVVMTEIGKFYGLPVYINVGLTDSKCVDAQAGLESGTSLLLGALAGADIFGHLGIAGVDQAADPDMLVFQHEMLMYVERVLRGFKIDAEQLAADVIEAVGPGGNFLTEPHTLKFFREQVWMPSILDRAFWECWEENGRQTTALRSRARRDELLAGYQPVPLEHHLDNDVGRIVEHARNYL